jgi:hypothetical protein
VTAIRVVRLLAACGAAAMSCAGAAQQPDGKALLKGRVKPGMYETKAYNDLSGMPGVPKEQQKTTETHTRCVTAAEVDKGVELRSDCKVKDFKQTAASFEIVSTCPDGSLQELRIATTATGFSSVVKSESREKGKEHNMTMRTESRYLGACKG